MIRLPARDHPAVLGLYRAAPSQFPLIGAVALDAQDGAVHVDDPAHPRQAFVEHAFGFAQLLGEPTAEFEAALERRLFVERSFAAAKIRLYTPPLPAFLRNARHEPLRSWRQRFTLDGTNAAADVAAPADTSVAEVNERNIDAVERAFGVARRFWRNAADFIRNSNAVVILHGGAPASICYAAALVDGKAEIDVLTHPDHQRLGLAKAAVMQFVRRCHERGLTPLWDCFTNNTASVELSRSVGFAPKGPPYAFFTIPK